MAIDDIFNFGPQHGVKSPFPKKHEGKIIIDEVCRCGVRRSFHEDTIAFGHGGSSTSGCRKFTWKKFIYRRP